MKYEKTRDEKSYSPAQMQELKTYLQHAVRRGRLGRGIGPDQSYERLLYAAQERLSAIKNGYAEGIPKNLPEYKDWQAIVDIARTYGEEVSYASTYEQVSNVIAKITASIKPDHLSRKIDAEINRTKRAQYEDCTGV